MISKIAINIILIFLACIVQVSFINNSISPLNNLNLILVLIIFIAIIFNLSLAFLWGIVSGFILDSLSVATFGVYLSASFLIIIIINWLFKRFFTNKSIYTVLLLGLIGTILFKIFIWFFNYLAFYLKLSDFQVTFTRLIAVSLAWQVVLNLIFLTIIFLVVWYTSRRLKSQFLD